MKITSLARKSLPSSPSRPSPDDPSYRGWLKSTSVDDKITALKVRRRAVIDRIVEMEAAGARRSTQSAQIASVHLKALQLLSDGKPVEAPKPAENLESLFEEIEVIDLALKIAGNTREAEFLDKLAAEIKARNDEWNELIWQEATTFAKLAQLRTQREAFMASLAGAGALPQLPAASVSYAKYFQAGLPARQIIDEALKAGIVTPKEVQL